MLSESSENSPGTVSTPNVDTGRLLTNTGDGGGEETTNALGIAALRFKWQAEGFSFVFDSMRGKKKEPLFRRTEAQKNSGGDLLSHPVAQAVPSALESLTSEFGMESGVTPPQ